MELTKPKNVVSRRMNTLRRVLQVKAVYDQHYVEGMPDTVMHKNFIEKQFCISVSTLRKYLHISAAKRELELLESQYATAKAESVYTQLELFSNEEN